MAVTVSINVITSIPAAKNPKESKGCRNKRDIVAKTEMRMEKKKKDRKERGKEEVVGKFVFSG